MAFWICAIAFFLISALVAASKSDTSDIEFIGKLVLGIILFFVFGIILVTLTGGWD